MERSISWHVPQIFSVSALPGPAGSWAKADAPNRDAAARSLVLNRKTERIKCSVMCSQIDLRGAAGDSAVPGEEAGNGLAAVPELLAGRAVERIQHGRRAPAAGGCGEDDAVDDQGGGRRGDVSRGPALLERGRAVLLGDFPGGNRACGGDEEPAGAG